MTHSKFYNIHFPFYGLVKKPSEIKFDGDRILIRKTPKGAALVLDDRSFLTPDYLTRVFKIENKYEDNRCVFDYTCRKLEELLRSNVKWGIDNKAQLHDLSNKEIFKYKVTKVERSKDTLFWVKGISYPFNIPEHLLGIDIGSMSVGLVYIDNVWYLHRFDTLVSYANEIKI